MKPGAWRIDAASAQHVIQRFKARGKPPVIDYEHQTLHKEENGQPAPAAGFFRSLEWREGEGLFAQVELTARAKQYIADGEYRYVIPTNGFEPGYHQGEGDAWLVNAKGEKAPGYEEPQTVRETYIRALNADEREALRDVVEGRVTFEDFERRFDESEPTP